MIRGIHHTSIATRDLDRLLAFYVDLVGLEVVRDGSWSESEPMDTVVGLSPTAGRIVFLKAANMFIEMFQYDLPEPDAANPSRRPCDPGLTHICFDVIDVHAEYERLSAVGVPFHSPPTRLAYVDTCYARDPDGNIVEFQEIQNPRSRMQLSVFRQP